MGDEHLDWARIMLRERLERATHDDKSENDDAWLEEDRKRFPCHYCNGPHVEVDIPVTV